MPRHQRIEYPNYGAMFKDAALYGLKKGLIVGGVGATLLAVIMPETREHLMALYATALTASALAVTAVEVMNAPLEHRVIRPPTQNQDSLTQRM